MLIVYAQSKTPVRLTEERWEHICKRHPEMATQQERIMETVASPDVILEGDYGELLAVRHYEQTPLTSKYLATAYREAGNEDGFIVTAYFTSRISTRRTIVWKR